MDELPKNFPEYSIMYKTLTGQINTLKQKKENSHQSEIGKIESEIQRYESERARIRKMFPDNFFETAD